MRLSDILAELFVSLIILYILWEAAEVLCRNSPGFCPWAVRILGLAAIAIYAYGKYIKGE